MAEKIKLTPSELQAQASEMRALEQEYESLFASVTSELGSINRNWSAKLANNFKGKIISTQNTFSQLTEDLMNGAKVADTCAVTFETVDSQLAKLYLPKTELGKGNLSESFDDAFIYGLKDKWKEYIDIINGDKGIEEKKNDVIKWLKSIQKDMSGFKKYFEWLIGNDLDFPAPLKDGFDFIKNLDIANKIGPGYVNWLGGLLNGNIEQAIDGGKNIISGTFSLAGDIFKTTTNMLLDFKAGFILDYGKNMVTNWLDSIANETKVSEVYWNTFVNSGLDLFKDTVCNVPSLVIGYLPAKGISKLFGFDLQSAYESVSGKKGFAAVTDSVEKLGNIIRENSTWENWKSGMRLIGDKISGLFK